MVYPFPRMPRQVSAGGLKVQDVFSITADTAANLDALSTTGWDLLIGKSRVNATDWSWRDSARGLSNNLKSNTSAAQGSFSNYATLLGSGDGLLTRSKKAAKFFDVKSGVASGSAVTISHDLGVTPGMVLCKDMDGAQSWIVYHRSTSSPTGKYLLLDSTSAENTFAGVFSASASSFTLNGIATNGHNYVFLLFAHDPDTSAGIIQCGSFTTDGSGNATITTGWEPQLALVKVSSTGGNWVLLDQTRGWASGNDHMLSPNSATAEDGIFGAVDASNPSSTGFTVTGNIMPASATGIYMTIRKGPM